MSWNYTAGSHNTINEVNEYKRFNKHTTFDENEAVKRDTPVFFR